MKRFVPEFILEWVSIWKTQGFRQLVKQKGWKVVIIIICYYLIRDTILYILIPYGIYKGCS